jgi:hypothetical protein
VRAPEDAVAPQLHLAMALVAAASGQAVEREHADDSSLFVSFTTRALPARRSSVAARPWAWITAKSKGPFPGEGKSRSSPRSNSGEPVRQRRVHLQRQCAASGRRRGGVVGHAASSSAVSELNRRYVYDAHRVGRIWPLDGNYWNYRQARG